MVILNATTEDTGASSPVTNTCALFCAVDDELLTPLQAAKLSAKASNPASDRDRFMVAPVNQNLWGSRDTRMKTRAVLGSLHYVRTDDGGNRD